VTSLISKSFELLLYLNLVSFFTFKKANCLSASGLVPVDDSLDVEKPH